MADSQSALAMAMMNMGNRFGGQRRYDPKAAQGALYTKLAAAGTDSSPVGHWTQALARVLQGGLGGYMTGKGIADEDEGMKSLAEVMGKPNVNDEEIRAAAIKAGYPDIAINFALAKALTGQQQQRAAGSVSTAALGVGGGGSQMAGGTPSASGGVFDVPETFKPHVMAASKKYGVPPELIASTIWNESRWNPNAVNPGDQKGSINPATGKPYDSIGLGQWGEQWARDRKFDPRDPLASIDQTAAALAEHTQKYGNPLIARLAYGWGSGNVDKWLAAGADPEKIPDGAKVWLPRTAFGIADEQQARAAWPQVASMLRPGQPMPAGGQPTAAGPQVAQAGPPMIGQSQQAPLPISGGGGPVVAGPPAGVTNIGASGSGMPNLNPIARAQAAPPPIQAPAGVPTPPPSGGQIPMGSGPIPAELIQSNPQAPPGAPLQYRPDAPMPPSPAGIQAGAPSGGGIGGMIGGGLPAPPPSMPPNFRLGDIPGAQGAQAPQGAPPMPPVAPPVAAPVAPPQGPPAASVPAFQPKAFAAAPNPHIQEAQIYEAQAKDAQAGGRLKEAKAYYLKAQEAQQKARAFDAQQQGGRQAHDAAEAARRQDYEFKAANERRDAQKPAMSAEAAKIKGLVDSGLNGISEMERLLFDKKGNLQTELVLQRQLPTWMNGPRGRELLSAAYMAADADLRLRTGAQAPQAEIERQAAALLPDIRDDAASVKYKLGLLRQYLGGIQQSLTAPAGAPGATPQAQAPAASPTASQQTTAPPAAIDMLRKNPALAPQFDEKYGAGASQRALGGR